MEGHARADIAQAGAAARWPGSVVARYRALRVEVLVATFLGYALYYFCRKNISIAMPALGRDLGYSNTQLGILGTLLYLTYGVGKLVNGAAGDHVDPRRFMALGLLLSGACSVAFGLAPAAGGLALLGTLWALNGWFQSMGFPPCARLLSTWYSVSERGLMWGLWNISHQAGAVGIVVLAGWLVGRSGWRAAFVVPGLLCAAAAVLLYLRLPGTPASQGLPPVGAFRGDPELDRDGTVLDDAPEGLRKVLWDRVLRSGALWLLSLMNLFVYVVRSGAFDWATKYLVERKHSTVGQAGWATAAFEVAGVAGSLLGGVLSDRLHGGRRAPMCFLFMLLTAAALYALWAVPPGHPAWDAAALGLVGFAIYGPQFLVGVFATDLCSPKAAATAIGLTGVFGYAGSALSGVGTGHFVDRHGWGGGFALWGAAALCGALCALPLWRRGPRRAPR